MTSPQIGRYQIQTEIGRGGMATVYLAFDPRLETNVAVKVLPREFLHDRTFRIRFEREAKTLARLRQDAIVSVLDYGEQDDQPYLVMEFMPGGSLAQRIEQGPLSIEEASIIVVRLAAALDRAHQRGIVHRDLKPGNILFDEYGDAHLADFGIAKLVQGTSTLTTRGLVGTPQYMSPEHFQALELDGRSDIYAMGVVLYEMLCGHPPYQADTPPQLMKMHLMDPVPPILEHRPHLPRTCQKVIDRALAKTPAERFQTANELAVALTALIELHTTTQMADITGETVIEPAFVTPETIREKHDPGALHPMQVLETLPQRHKAPRSWKTLSVGGLLLLAGLVIFLAFISPTNSVLVRALAQLFGVGRCLLPIGLLILGIWTILNSHGNRMPRLRLRRIIGTLMIFLGSLTSLHYMLFPVSLEATQEIARIGGGGGYIGGYLMESLVQSMGWLGAGIALIIWLTIGVILGVDKSIGKLSSVVATTWRRITR